MFRFLSLSLNIFRIFERGSFLNRLLDKYLNRAAVSELFPEPGRKFSSAVVIPAFAEKKSLPAVLNSLSANATEFLRDTMVIVVVNNPPGRTPAEYRENQRVWEMLRGDSLKMKNPLNLFAADAFSPGREIPVNEGVGGARKTGMDTALRYLDFTKAPLIFSLDADTPVKDNYLESSCRYMAFNPSISSASIKFRHRPEGGARQEKAAGEYDFFIRYYTAGLKYACSPYAYQVLGSAIVCRAEAYIKAGGMRRRNGGEDFYFMQALRKNGPVGEINSTCVYPASRLSRRVPFGTGPGVRGALEGKDIMYYNPLIFEILQQWNLYIRNAEIDDFESLSRFQELNLPDEIKEFLDLNNFSAAWEKIKNNFPRNPKQLRNALNIWFDAFKTLKFVHFCEREYPERFERFGVEEAREISELNFSRYFPGGIPVSFLNTLKK
jgi:GT2 family glycosyltransferase